MMENLPITPRTADDLSQIAGIDASSFVNLIASLGRMAKLVPFKDLSNTFRTHVGDDGLGEILLGHIASLSLKRDDDDLSGTEIVEALLAGVRDAGEEELADSVEAIKTHLIGLVEDETVYFSIKGMKLFAQDSLHLHDFKIVCDARPIFGRQRQSIHAFMVFASMQAIGADDSENEQRIRIALKASQLTKLRNECDRALQKLDTLSDTLDKVENAGVVIYGRD